MEKTRDIVDAPLHKKETDYHYIISSYFPPQFKFVGILLGIAGVVLILDINIIGLILLMISLLFLFAKNKFTFSFSLMRYKEGMSIFGNHFGKWKSFPNFEYISMFTASKRQELSVQSQMSSTKITEIDVNLIYNANRRLTVFSNNDYQEAYSVAKLFSDKLSLKIYDATNREGVWLDEI